MAPELEAVFRAVQADELDVIVRGEAHDGFVAGAGGEGGYVGGDEDEGGLVEAREGLGCEEREDVGGEDGVDALGAGFGQLVGQRGRRCGWEGRFGVVGAGGRCCAGEDALFVGGNAVVVGGEALGRCHGEVLDEMLSCRWESLEV